MRVIQSSYHHLTYSFFFLFLIIIYY